MWCPIWRPLYIPSFSGFNAFCPLALVDVRLSWLSPLVCSLAEWCTLSLPRLPCRRSVYFLRSSPHRECISIHIELANKLSAGTLRGTLRGNSTFVTRRRTGSPIELMLNSRTPWDMMAARGMIMVHGEKSGKTDLVGFKSEGEDSVVE